MMEDQGEEPGLNPQLLQGMLGEIERQCNKDPSLVGQIHQLLANMHTGRAVEVSKEPQTKYAAFRQLNSETRKGNPEKRSDPMQPMIPEQQGMDSVSGNSTGAAYDRRNLLYQILRTARTKARRIASDGAIDIAVRTAVRRARRQAQGAVATFEARHPQLAKG
jgi:hypothetical protein